MMRFTSNGSRVMAEMTAATRAANRAIELQTAQVNRATLAMQRFKAEAVGVGLTMAKSFAIAGAAVGAYSVVQAASLQRTLTAIGNETGAKGAKLDQFRAAAFQIGNQIGVAPTDAAQILLQTSRLTAGQLQVAQMLKVAPSIAQFASVLNYNRPNVSVEDAVTAGLQLVHQFRAYQPTQSIPLLDKAYRLSGLMTETPEQAVRQMSYYEPLFKGLKISNDTSIAMMALLDRAGFRMKVGTNVRAMMLQALGPLQLTSHVQGAKLDYLEQMGVFNRRGQFAWNTPDGGVNFLGVLGQISRWTQAQERAGVPASQLAKIVYSVFGKQGGTIAQLMADPVMMQILTGIQSYLGNPNVSLAAGARNRENTLGFQAGRAWANLKADLTELGWVTLPKLTGDFRSLGNTLHDVQVWLHQHRTAEQWITGGIAGATGLSAAAVAVAAFGNAIAFVNRGFTAFGATKVLQFGRDVAGLNGPLSSATGSLGALASVLRGISGSLGFLGAGFTISGAQQSSATAAYQSIARKYGSKYANYLLRDHPGGGEWPWNADPGQIPKNALSPKDWNLLNLGSGIHASAPVHVEQHFTVSLAPGTTRAQAKQIVELGMEGLSRDLRTRLATQGRYRTHPDIPAVTNINIMSPSLGLS